MIFDFQAYPARGHDGRLTNVYRPMIPVTITGPEGTRDTLFALLDTGSDDTLFPDYLAGFLGIDLPDDERSDISTLSGTIRAVYRPLRLSIASGGQIIKWEAIVGFHDGPHYNALFGHDGFFDRFLVLFNCSPRRIAIEAVL